MTEKSAYCLVSIAPVRAEASDKSEIVTQLLFGEIIEVIQIEAPWAKIAIVGDGYEGYIDYKHVQKLSDRDARIWTNETTYLSHREVSLETPWGNQRIYRGSLIPENVESFKLGLDSFNCHPLGENHCSTLYEFAQDYLNTPYLWGGKSPCGIDCSGITQVIYRLFGWNLPRDASEQVLHGQDVDFQNIQSGDLAYFTNTKGIVTHVGILDDNGHIIHASGHVREDILSTEGIIHSKTGIHTHNLYSIKRM